MLSIEQNKFLDWVIELAPAVQIAAQYAPSSDEHLQSAMTLYCDHLDEAMKLITPLAKASADPARES